MLDAVIYDFGGVFIPSPFTAVRRIAAERGIADEVLTAIVFGSYDDDTDHPWHRAERGEVDIISAARAIGALAAEHEVEVDLFETLKALGGNGTLNEAMIASVRRAREAGARTAMLTNNVAEGRDIWQKLLPIDELFDAVVDSSAVGMRKPNPKVYEHTLEVLGVDEPGRSAFLDDYPGNVVAAAALGIIGILVEDDPTSAIERLDALLL